MSKQSLAAQAGALQGEFKLPEVFSAPMVPVKGMKIAPYVTFAHPKRADEWSKLTAKFGEIFEGDMFLITSNELTPLPQARMSLMANKQFWVHKNAAGTETLAASWDEMPKPFNENIEAVVLVYLEDRVLPANILFRTTKCPAGKTLSDAHAECQTLAWAEKGPAYKETLVCAQPFMRYYGVVSLGPQRTSKSSGLPYRPTVCSVKPTAVQEWRLLKAFIDDPESQVMLNDAAMRFQSRVNDVATKVK